MFNSIINEYPNWVWGYIEWGDIYAMSRVVSNPKMAEKIYKMAFDVKLEDEEDSLSVLSERLEDLEY